MESLSAAPRLAGWLGQAPPELDRRAAFDALLDILASQRLDCSDDASGGVRVLSASSIRSLRVPHLFLANLSEGVFPPPDREDRFYGEAELGRLIEAGLPLVARRQRAHEEMLLFYEAITRAERRLYLSYPALDDAAQPLLPSPFLREVEQALGADAIPRTRRADLSPIPDDDDPPAMAELRVKALASALEGNVALLAGLFAEERGERREERDSSDTFPSPPSPFLPPLSSLLSPLSSALAAGLDVIQQRQQREGFGPAEGVLQGEAARSYFAARFHAAHVFAATDLERYAECPFRFFLERILEVEPVEDLSLEFDVLARGRAVHEVLAALHRRVNQRLGRPASPLELDPAELDAMLGAALDEALPPIAEKTVAAALREVDRRLLVQWLAQYRRQVEQYDALWTDFDRPMMPELFETSFGRGDPEPPSTGRPLEFAWNGHTLLISGRIDRVDVGTVAGQAVFNVLDYKSGGPIRFSAESILSGLTLQLPLYALAAMELLLANRDLIPWQAGYWHVRDQGYKPKQALRMYRNDDGRIELEPQWERVRAELAATVAGLVGNIRGGRFPVSGADAHCTGRCPYATVCRIGQVRSLEKTCNPTLPQ